MRRWLPIVLTVLVLAGRGLAQTPEELSDDPADEYTSPRHGQRQRERLRAIEEHAEDEAADPDEHASEPQPEPADAANEPPAPVDPDVTDPDVDPSTDPDAPVVDPDTDPTNEDRLSDEVLKDLAPPTPDDDDAAPGGRGGRGGGRSGEDGGKVDAPTTGGPLDSPLQVPDEE